MIKFLHNLNIGILFTFTLFTFHVYAADYLLLTENGSSASMLGIGGISGFSKSADAIFENPAALANIKNFSASMFYVSYMQAEVPFHCYSIGSKTPFGNIALGYMSTSIGDIPLTVIDKNQEFVANGSFGYSNYFVKLAYQKSIFDYLSLGLSLNYFKNEIYNVSGSGVNSDLGFLFTYDNVTFSSVAQNLLFFANIKYSNNSQESIPVEFVNSLEYSLLPDLKIYSQIKSIESRGQLLSYGLRYQPDFLAKCFYLSAGNRDYFAANHKKNKSSFGTGLELGIVNFNFAMEMSDYFNEANQYYYSFTINGSVAK